MIYYKFALFLIDNENQFTDQSTGLVWIDLDNYWGSGLTYDSIQTSLDGSGFHIATGDGLLALQSSAGSNPADFSTNKSIMQSSPGSNFDMIWGVLRRR